LREVEAPTFSNIRLTDGGKVVSVGRFLPPRKMPGTHFCQRMSRLQEHNAAGRMKYIKNSTSSGTRTGDLPAFGIVSQPTTLSRGLHNF
jgi:hypothetical protein